MSDIAQKYKPARMSLTNLATATGIEAQFNPTELEESLAVNWNRLAVLGLSHKPKQYQQTDNHEFEFELAFRAWDDTGNRLDDIALSRRFLLSLCYSSRASAGSGVSGGAPPRVLFVWPKLVSLTATINKIRIKHSAFNKEGDPIHFAAKIELDEIRDARLYSEDVYLNGTIRSSQ